MTHQKIAAYIDKQTKFKSHLSKLRELCLKQGLKEDVKWGMPAYLYNGKNIIGISAFKNYCGMWFHQGVFIEDKHNMLVNAQEGKTKAMRQMRFTESDKIAVRKVNYYIKAAIDNAKAGKQLKVLRKKAIPIPNLLNAALNEDPKLKAAFTALRPSYQNEFKEYIIEAKREATKQKRLEKSIPLILQGISMNDKYR